MSWLLLTALGMIWAAFLLPSKGRKGSPQASVADFERKMELLAETEAFGQGRWIVVPRKGARFIGPRARAHARACERRRRVFVFFLESIGLTFLIGLVPPLRVMWVASGILFGLLALYVWLLVSLQQQSPRVRARRQQQAAAVPRPRPRLRPVGHQRPAAAERYVSEGRHARPTFNGLGSLVDGDRANIVVRRAREVGVAGA